MNNNKYVRLKDVIDRELKKGEPHQAFMPSNGKIKRNDPCWCNSGEKYKKCHMELEHELARLERHGYEVPDRRLQLPEEVIEAVKACGDVVAMILEELNDIVKVGVTTKVINDYVHRRADECGVIPATIGYNGYQHASCTSINNVVCHGIPSDETLKDGDIINVDITMIKEGLYADASRMYLVGNVDEEGKRLVDVTKECLEIGMAQVKPFATVNDIGKAIEEHAHKHGYTVVEDFTGHGIGFNFHEAPQVCHYDIGEEGMVLVPGMVFTIEPMINEGSYECYIDKEDGWTARTIDGKRSAQWEQTLVVTETGYRILTDGQ